MIFFKPKEIVNKVNLSIFNINKKKFMNTINPVIINKLILKVLVVMLLISCKVTLNNSTSGKTKLESEIIEQVKFLQESESYSTINDEMVKHKIPALSLAIINQGKIEWTGVYQNPNFTKQNLDSKSIFQAASLSKPVTFLAALRMHAVGEIDLDKNIEDYLKDYTLPKGKQTEENPVTFRNIFAHTSGISSGGYIGYHRINDVIPTDLDILQGKKGANSPAIKVIEVPNKKLAYSGGAYTLAELALQDYYNKGFSDIMHEWILKPSGMTLSKFTQPIANEDSTKVVKAYTYRGTMVKGGGWRNHPEQAAAGLWSNPTDMAKLLIEIYKGYQGKSTVFSQSDIKKILSHERERHVYGFIVNRTEDDIAITHYGGNVGYRTGMTISLTTGKGMVYMTNSDNGGTLGNKLLLSASRVYDWKHFNRLGVQRDEVSSDTLKKLAGKYWWKEQVNLSIKINESHTQISLIWPNGDEYKLIPIRGDELDFIHSESGVKVSFKADLKSFSLFDQLAVKLEGERPKIEDYSLGEKWVWKYKGVSGKGKVRSKGIDTKTIVKFKGELGMTVGKDTVLISDILKPNKSKTPRFLWPLEVGKKWKYETEFTSADGSNTGVYSQDAEVLSYKKVTVAAGTFMAYTIQYKGGITTSKGVFSKTDDVFVYAPEIKNFIMMTQDQDGFSYTEELIEYSK